MAGFWVRRRRGAQEPEVHGADLAKRAGSALLAADERIRLAVDEFGFAEAELGSDATAAAAEALVAARRRLGDAFRLNRLARDAMPGTTEDARARYLEVLQVCESIDAALDAQASTLTERMARARRAPEIIAGVRGDVELLRAHVPDARGTVERLAARYARSALAEVETNPAEAEQLLGFAEHSVGVAERRREAGRRDQASVALEASVAAVRRAASLLEAVEDFEVAALQAESALGAVAEESRRDLAAALALAPPRSPDVATAIAELQAALDALPRAGVDTDPLGHLARLRAAHTALDVATAAARDRATRPALRSAPPRHPMHDAPDLHDGHPVYPSRPLRAEHDLHPVHHALRSADRQLDVARDAIAAHPGWIGGEALTRLAESERIRIDLGHLLGGAATTFTLTDDVHRERIVALARRAASLASESAQLARRDIDAFRSQGVGRRGGQAATA